MNQTTLTGHAEGFARMEANTISDLKKVKDRVEYILQNYPSAKGDDNILIWRYLLVFCPSVRMTYREFQDLMGIPSFETITRCRRKLNEAGLYLPTSRTVRKRRRREEIIREGVHGV